MYSLVHTVVFLWQTIREAIRDANVPSTSARGPNDETMAESEQSAYDDHASATNVREFQEPVSQAKDEQVIL